MEVYIFISSFPESTPTKAAGCLIGIAYLSNRLIGKAQKINLQKLS